MCLRWWCSAPLWPLRWVSTAVSGLFTLWLQFDTRMFGWAQLLLPVTWENTQ